MVKQIIEKAHEHKIDIELLFIDFNQAFDSIKREKLIQALKELGIKSKTRRLVRMTMDMTMTTVKTLKGETREFEINKGVKQGDALSATLFNLSLEYIMRRIHKGTLRTRGVQITAYADDVVVAAKTRNIMRETLQEITTEGRKIGLEINTNKTKIMRIDKFSGSREIQIGEYTFEEVGKFRYLGIMLDYEGGRETEIREKIMAVNRARHAYRSILKNKTLTKMTKIRAYKTIIRPIMLYAAETMTMSKRDEEDIRIMERKIIRTITGPVKVDENVFRTKMNFEIEQELEGVDVVSKIKQQRAKWLGHVWRSKDGDIIKEMLQWDPGGRKRRGRPRSTWKGEVVEDLKKVGVNKWQKKQKLGRYGEKYAKG